MYYEYDIIISQRGWFDSYVHGAVKGFSYSFIGQLCGIEELPTCDVMIHLVANASVAYARIKDDPDADKFEYPSYIRTQELETRRGYQELIDRNLDLYPFFKVHNTLIDTTNISMEETFKQSKKFLQSINM